MKIVLIILAFTINPDGGMTQVGEPEAIEFNTLAECNQVGRNFRNYVQVPEHIKTITVCLSL